MLVRFLKNRSLTLVLMALFLGTWGGQFAVGRQDYNNERREHALPPLSIGEYLTSGHFWQATAENWESEFLQMAMFVVLTVFLYQKGSPESKDPDKSHEESDDDPARHRSDPRAPWPVRRGGWIAALYANSLSLTLFALFLVSFAVHALKGVQIYNEEQIQAGRPAVTVWGYVGSATFWFESLQNWQSEFLSIAAMVYLSVYLRQRHSPESKPVHAAHTDQE